MIFSPLQCLAHGECLQIPEEGHYFFVSATPVSLHLLLLWSPHCCCSVAKSCPTLRNAMDCMQHRQASLSFTISPSLLKLMSVESVMPSNHLILCHPLLLQPSIFPSIRVISNESALPHIGCLINPCGWIY